MDRVVHQHKGQNLSFNIPIRTLQPLLAFAQQQQGSRRQKDTRNVEDYLCPFASRGSFPDFLDQFFALLNGNVLANYSKQ
jgi:hypothetical protein